MTTTDISLSAHKSFPRKAHVAVPQIQGTHYVAHTWSLKFFAHSVLDIPWRPTHLLLSLEYFKTRPLILSSAKLLFSTQADFVPLTIHYSSFLF